MTASGASTIAGMADSAGLPGPAPFHHGCPLQATAVPPGFPARLWHNNRHPAGPVPGCHAMTRLRPAAVLVAALTYVPLVRAEDAKPDLLPLTKLPPAKVRPGQCVLTYRIGTRSPECQAHFDQGLGYFYSYVWMEAARSFETAAKFDPDCPMAWW